MTAMPTILENKAIQRLLVIAIFFWLSCSIGYWAITKYDIYDEMTGGPNGDVAQYIKMSRAEPLDTIPKPFRYRVVIPYLAGKVPTTVPGGDIYYDLTEEKRVALQFGVVNILGMTMTAYFLFLSCGALGLGFFVSFLASLLFLTSFYTINYAAVPLVDAWAHATLIAGIYCIQKKQYVALTALSLAAVFIKETYLLMLFFCVIIPDDRKEKLKFSACILPALMAYMYFRMIMLPTELGSNYSVEIIWNNFVRQMSSVQRHVALIIEGIQSFGILWVFLIIYVLFFRSDNRIITKNLIIIPVVMIVPFLIYSNVGRIWFFAFPAVIPAAAYVISRVCGPSRGAMS